MEEKTIRKLVVDFALNSPFPLYLALLGTKPNEQLGHLEDVAQYKMGFEEGVHVNLNGGKDLHEWTHAISAILRGEDLEPPDIPRELCAFLINKALVHPLTDSDFFISIKQDLTTSLKRLREGELNSLMEEVLENTLRNSLEAFVLQYNQNLFKIADLSGDKALQILTLQVLASLDFNPEVIGRCFEEEVKQKVIEINEKYQLENLIKDEEINEHIKLALIIRLRIKSIYGKEWKEMDYTTEQPNLKISEILPDITVSELKEIEPQHLINWLNHGISYAIDHGLPEATAQRIDEVGYALYIDALKASEPKGEIENPKIKTNENFLNSSPHHP